MSKVKDFNPDTIDSVDLGEEPGTISRIDPTNNIVEDSTSTHRLPLTKLIDYLKAEIAVDIVLLGIQPARPELNSDVSDEVEKAVGGACEYFDRKVRVIRRSGFPPISIWLRPCQRRRAQTPSTFLWRSPGSFRRILHNIRIFRGLLLVFLRRRR